MTYIRSASTGGSAQLAWPASVDVTGATPVSLRLLGRRRVAAHSQPTTRIGAVYSSSRATPTDRWATALK
jgi:hypothetical protein